MGLRKLSPRGVWRSGNGQRRFSGGDGGETTLAKHVERFEAILVPKKVPLTIERILDCADAFHAAHGRWPIAAPVPIAGVPGESWARIDEALRRRERGLAGYSSLANLLAACRGAGNLTGPPRLRIDQILAWADSYHAAHGRWPIAAPVAVAEAPEESWDRIDQALRQGERGLPGGSSLTRLLADAGVLAIRRHPLRSTRSWPGPMPTTSRTDDGPSRHPSPWPRHRASRGTGSTECSAGRRGRCRWAPRWPACSPNAAACVIRRGFVGCGSTRSCNGPTHFTQQTDAGPFRHLSPWPRRPTSRGTGSTGASAGANGDCRGAPR